MGHAGQPVGAAGSVTRADELRVDGQVMQFFFRDDDRTPADSASNNGMVFRRRSGR